MLATKCYTTVVDTDSSETGQLETTLPTRELRASVARLLDRLHRKQHEAGRAGSRAEPPDSARSAVLHPRALFDYSIDASRCACGTHLTALPRSGDGPSCHRLGTAASSPACPASYPSTAFSLVRRRLVFEIGRRSPLSHAIHTHFSALDELALCTAQNAFFLAVRDQNRLFFSRTSARFHPRSDPKKGGLQITNRSPTVTL